MTPCHGCPFAANDCTTPPCPYQPAPIPGQGELFEEDK